LAIVINVEPEDKRFSGLHPTGLVCRYLAAYSDGQRILQLNTYGSEGRQNPDKLSQTLQFDERSARQLFDVLKDQFGFDSK
jgi:hypothetical protein